MNYEDEETVEHGAAEAEAPETEESKAAAAANADQAPEGDDQADESADDGQEESGSPADDEEDRKSRSQRQRERRKAYIAELEKKANDAQAAMERLKKAHEGRKEPQEAEYDDPTEYAVARVLWQQRHADASEQQSEAEAAYKQVEEQRMREVAQAWADRVNEAKGRYEDFNQIALGGHWQPSPAMVEIIQASDSGPDLAYHLGSNPAEASRIAGLPPASQAYELGRIESRLTAPKPRTKTSAPPPIKPVGGRASGEKDPAKMTNEEFRAARAKGLIR